MSNKIYKQMSLVMADIGSVGKDNKNTAQGWKFRGIDQFVNSLYPALVKHGVFMAPKVVSANNLIKEVANKNGGTRLDKHVDLLVEYTFYAEDGSSVTVGPIASEGIDSGDKATNKALSAALKYALIQTFSIPTEDMVDGDADSPEIGKSTSSGSASVATVEAATAVSTAKAKPSFRKPAAKATEVIVESQGEDLI